MTTDEQLFFRTLKGDQAAFEEIYSRYFRKVLGLCYSVLRDNEDAEEAANRAFFKVWHKRKSFKFQAKVSSYVYIIAKREALMLLRSRNSPTRTISETTENLKIIEFAGSYEHKADPYLKRHVSQAFRTIKNLKEKEAFIDFITIKHSCAQNTKKSRLNRARIRMRNYLLERGIDRCAA
jgi:RNA polymerase sigma-70 factor (ECF subfamily)